MDIKKPLAVVGTIATIGLITLAGSAMTHAADSTTTSNPMSNLVSAIATKFNLNTTDVQAVFDQQKQVMDAERTAAEKTKLDTAVKDSKITQAQEDLIIAKQAEMKTYMDSLKDKTEDERHTAMETKMDELQQWAKDNNIDQQYIHGGFGGGHGGRGGFGHGAHSNDTNTTTSTTAS